jgi:hypothetical protein
MTWPRPWGQEMAARRARALTAAHDDAPRVVTCPHCVGIKARGCCVCKGQKAVTFNPALSEWLWHYADCKCRACRILKEQYEAQHGPCLSAPMRPHVEAPCFLH